jgi:hypothetical protein
MTNAATKNSRTTVLKLKLPAVKASMALDMILGSSKLTPLLSRANTTRNATIPRYGFSKLNTFGLDSFLPVTGCFDLLILGLRLKIQTTKKL